METPAPAAEQILRRGRHWTPHGDSMETAAPYGKAAGLMTTSESFRAEEVQRLRQRLAANSPRPVVAYG